MATKDELKAERMAWAERSNTVQVAMQLANTQAVLLQYQAKECQSEIARLDKALADFPEEATNGPKDAAGAAPPAGEAQA